MRIVRGLHSPQMSDSDTGDKKLKAELRQMADRAEDAAKRAEADAERARAKAESYRAALRALEQVSDGATLPVRFVAPKSDQKSKRILSMCKMHPEGVTARFVWEEIKKAAPASDITLKYTSSFLGRDSKRKSAKIKVKTPADGNVPAIYCWKAAKEATETTKAVESGQ